MPNSAKTRLLVVDDEPGMRRTLSRIMKAKGYDVQVAADGETAIQLSTEFQPDIFLMDIRMPGIDGVETWLRVKPACPDAAVIFMTAYASDESTLNARDAGALEVFAKPLEIDSLCRIITSVGRPILIVDDDPGFRDSLQRALQQHSFRVHCASDMDDAIDRFQRRQNSVVLLDMNLQKVSGLEVLNQIRSYAEDVLVFLMTGFSELADEIQTGLKIGASASFTKPFDVEELVREIRRVTGAEDAG